MNLLIAAADPMEHAVPHALHDGWLFRMPFPFFGQEAPFFGVHGGYYDFYITNHLMMTLVAAVLLLLTAWFASGRVRVGSEQGLARYQTKGRISQLFEMVCTFIRDEVAKPNLGSLTDKYIFYIWTVFFFVLFANILGVIPFGAMLEMLTGNAHFSHWGGSATGNISLTLMLAMLSLIAVIYIGIKETGAKAFFNHFNPIGWDMQSPFMLGIGVMLYVLEWMSLLIKSFVLAMRLFGTMMAGHLVLAAFVGLILAAREGAGLGASFAVGVPVVLICTALTLLELFICMLQAFIFTFLTVLFISATAVHEHDEHEHSHGDESAHAIHHGKGHASGTQLSPA
jgi:F-type H+-transporting ATPase subunit a